MATGAIFSSSMATSLPDWDTSSTLDATTWIQRLSLVKEALRATDQEAKTLATTKLRCDRSSQIMIPLAADAEITWEDYVKVFCDEFGQQKPRWQLESELRNMKMPHHVSITEFARTFDRHAAKLPYDDEWRTQQFIETLPRDWSNAARTLYAMAKINSASLTVRALAASLDFQFQGSQRPAVPSSDSTRPQQSNFGRSPHHSHNSGRYGDSQMQPRPPMVGASPNPVIPVRPPFSQSSPQSGNSGYSVRRVDENSQFRPLTSSSTGQDVRQATSQRSTTTATCYYCGEVGHYRSGCPKLSRPPASINTVNAVGSKAPFRVTVTVDSKPTPYNVPSLLDTGADANVLCADVWRAISPLPALQQSDIELHGVTKDMLHIRGKVALNLVIKGRKIKKPVEFLVAENCVQNLILGRPFIEAHVQSIRGCDGDFTLNSEPTPYPSPSFSVDAQLLDSVSVQARTMDVIEATVPSRAYPESWDCLFTPTPEAVATLGLDPDSTFMTVRNNKLRLSVCNATDEPIHLASGSTVGSVSEAKVVQPSPMVSSILAESVPDVDIRHLLHGSVEMDDIDKENAEDLLLSFEHLFGEKLTQVNPDTHVKHSIPTGSHAPVAVKPYRVAVHMREALNKELEAMLAAGVIKKSHSPWAAPVVLVAKKDGGIRVCIDYRKLNAVTERDQYPLPRITELLDSIPPTATVFSTMDLLCGFYQVGVNPEDQPKTAFSTEQGLYEFTVMPFGLSNSPATFQRLIDHVLRELRRISAWFIDDVLAYSDDVKTHINDLAEIFSALQDNGLIIKRSKCVLFRSSVKFLGHCLSAGTISPDPAKTDCVRTWPRPNNVKQLQASLGLFGYYRRFVPNFATVAEPLHALLRKNQPWSWTKAQDAAFDSLKDALVSEPVLCTPNFNLEFTVHTDASSVGLGAILSQVQDGKERVVCYGSKALSATQRRYSATDRECLAIYWALHLWRIYLLGRRFTVVTDHSALRWLFESNHRDPHNRLARMVHSLQEFEFNVVYRAGVQHTNADALSRMIPDSESPSLAEDIIINSVTAVTRSATNSLPPKQPRLDPELMIWDDADEERLIRESIQDAAESYIDPQLSDNDADSQSSDESDVDTESPLTAELNFQTLSLREPQPVTADWFEAVELAESDIQPTMSRAIIIQAQHEDEATCNIKSKLMSDPWDVKDISFHRLRIDNDGLLVAGGHDHNAPDRPFIPVTMRPMIMAEFHDGSLAGHQGFTKTFELVSHRFFWPSMSTDIKEYVRSCPGCQARKAPGYLGSQPIGHVSRASGPFQRLGIDVLGPLPRTAAGNRFCLVAVDIFSRFQFVYPLPDQQAHTVAKILVENIFLDFGFPEELLSDRGQNFLSKLLHEVLLLFQVRKVSTLAYRPQSNGVVERQNHVIVSMLSQVITRHQDDWDEWLPYVAFAARAAPHSTLGKSPFSMMFGREVMFPSEAQLQPRPTSGNFPVIEDIAAKIADVKKFVSGRFDKVDMQRALENSKKKLIPDFQLGDLVLHCREAVTLGTSRKLTQLWEGPYEIMEARPHSQTYLCRPDPSDKHLKEKVFHRSTLKKFILKSSSLLRQNQATPTKRQRQA